MASVLVEGIRCIKPIAGELSFRARKYRPDDRVTRSQMKPWRASLRRFAIENAISNVEPRQLAQMRSRYSFYPADWPIHRICEHVSQTTKVAAEPHRNCGWVDSNQFSLHLEFVSTHPTIGAGITPKSAFIPHLSCHRQVVSKTQGNRQHRDNAARMTRLLTSSPWV